ncbi:phosphate uptake regulator PhoU [Candidatus Woesearchaeota archaeon]|nr:phosphate uptake regulator PhoU [Candidatus Woesearchaeota archaeon]
MKRKVVKHGTTTLSISLPAKWVKTLNIKQGEELDVEERGNNLIIQPYYHKQGKEITITINEKENIPARLLQQPYISGYNKIRINYMHREVVTYIQNIINGHFMGFEVVEQGKNYCVIKNVARGIEEEFDVMFNRLTFIAMGMLRDINEYFMKGDASAVSETESAELVANKINLFCRRMLNEIGHKDRRVTSMYATSLFLEAITDECNVIGKYLKENNIATPSNEVRAYTNMLVQFIELWYKAFVNKQGTGIEIKNIDLLLKKDGVELLEKSTKNERVITHSLMVIRDHLHNLSEETF